MFYPVRWKCFLCGGARMQTPSTTAHQFTGTFTYGLTYFLHFSRVLAFKTCYILSSLVPAIFPTTCCIYGRKVVLRVESFDKKIQNIMTLLHAIRLIIACITHFTFFLSAHFHPKRCKPLEVDFYAVSTTRGCLKFAVRMPPSSNQQQQQRQLRNRPQTRKFSKVIPTEKFWPRLTTAE